MKYSILSTCYFNFIFFINITIIIIITVTQESLDQGKKKEDRPSKIA